MGIKTKNRPKTPNPISFSLNAFSLAFRCKGVSLSGSTNPKKILPMANRNMIHKKYFIEWY
jgi:hypothetical protein